MTDTHAPASGIRLVAGLGNPGRRYEGTRHNIGFDAVDRVVAEAGADWSSRASWEAEVARLGAVFLIKPMTYMNRSGRAVAAVARYHRIAADGILVVYDDVALPLGRLRIRRSGSDGGHNGMRSVIEALGTREVARLRIGVGAPPGGPGETSVGGGGEAIVSHVLGRFGGDEREAARRSAGRAAEAISRIFQNGIDEAMNIYNKDEAI